MGRKLGSRSGNDMEVGEVVKIKKESEIKMKKKKIVLGMMFCSRSGTDFDV